MTKKGCALILAATIVALALRLPRLHQRPMHGDEAVHAIKFEDLLERGKEIRGQIVEEEYGITDSKSK